MVANGKAVSIHYTGRIVHGDEPGDIFDTTDVDVALDEGIYHEHRDYRPLEFRVGEGEIIEGIDTAVKDMSPGETKTVRVDPESAYGQRRRELIQTVPRDELEANSEVSAAEGELVVNHAGTSGWILDVADDSVTIDFNHELAGELLEFEIHLIEVFD